LFDAIQAGSRRQSEAIHEAVVSQKQMEAAADAVAGTARQAAESGAELSRQTATLEQLVALLR
jgi:hypothetical protein